MKFNKILFLLIFSLLSLFSQSQTLGALFLSDSDYAKLPRPNWDTLQKYSNLNAIVSSSSYRSTSGVTMLVNPPIGDQGPDGTCVGWGVGYSAMGILTYPKYYCWSTAERSPDYIYNQIKISDCSAGSYIKDGLNLILSQGDCSWMLMPYVNGDCSTQPNSTQINDAGQNKAYQWVALNRNDVAGIKHALDLGLPVVNGFDVTSDFDNMWSYKGGIWTTNAGGVRGGHATCIIGYDDSKQMFKAQNQWGVYGGDNGYYWVSYNLIQNNCMKELYIVYGISPSNPPSINGASPICSSNTYTINNLPTNVTVNWSSSPTGAVNFSCTSCSQTNISALGNGLTTIQASLTDNCTGAATNLYKNIVVGLPYVYSTYNYNGSQNPIHLWGSDQYYNPVCDLANTTITTDIEGASSFLWSKVTSTPSNISWTDNDGYNLGFYFWNVGQTAVFEIDATNACGTTTQEYGFQSVNCNSGGGGGCDERFSISPNPAKSSFRVVQPDIPAPCERVAGVLDRAKIFQHSIQSVKIYDRLGILRLQNRYYANTRQADINTSFLKSGVYFVDISDGQTTERHQLVITQ